MYLSGPCISFHLLPWKLCLISPAKPPLLEDPSCQPPVAVSTKHAHTLQILSPAPQYQTCLSPHPQSSQDNLCRGSHTLPPLFFCFCLVNYSPHLFSTTPTLSLAAALASHGTFHDCHFFLPMPKGFPRAHSQPAGSDLSL